MAKITKDVENVEKRKGRREYDYYATFEAHGLRKTFHSDTIRGLAKDLGINHLTAMRYCKLNGVHPPSGRMPLTISKVRMEVSE